MKKIATNAKPISRAKNAKATVKAAPKKPVTKAANAPAASGSIQVGEATVEPGGKVQASETILLPKSAPEVRDPADVQDPTQAAVANQAASEKDASQDAEENSDEDVQATADSATATVVDQMGTEIPVADLATSQASEAGPVNPFDGRTVFELRGMARAVGIQGYQTMSVGDLRFELSGLEAAVEAVNWTPETSSGLWVTEQTDGAVDAVDPEGWYRARVHADGSAIVHILASPNLHNRTDPTPNSDDQRIIVPDLGAFIERLQALRDAAG